MTNWEGDDFALCAQRSLRWEPCSKMRLSVCLSVCLYVRIFDDFYEGDMDPVRGLLPTGTLTKKISH